MLPYASVAVDSPPSPSEARTLDQIVLRLRQLKLWAGNPSYVAITRRINAGWSAAGRPASELTSKNTVADCFKVGRRRPNEDLMISIVAALHDEPNYVAEWARALKIALGYAEIATIVSASDRLPNASNNFVGRRVELDWLHNLVSNRTVTGNRPVVAVIDGMAGVGKTQLAVQACRHLIHDFGLDEVQLFVDLRGFNADPSMPPADPAAVLGIFLRLLGVPGSQVPPDCASRAIEYRKLLQNRRAVVVLDNAADAEQVQPLLPDSSMCVTLITSRRTLSDIPAQCLHLTEFTPADAVDLLRTTDVQRFDADSDAAVQIAELLGHLPLALGLVAGLIRENPTWTLTDHLERLIERRTRLRLDDGVDLALRLSYEDLQPGLRRMLRLVALHPGSDLEACGAAALADSDLDTAQRQLNGLLTANLLQQKSPGRYSLHDLVRIYAVDRSQDEDSANDRRSSLTRAFDYYRYNAARAMDVVAPHYRNRRPTVPDPGTPRPTLLTRHSATAWLDSERSNLVAVAIYASDHGWLDHTSHLSSILHRYFCNSAHYDDAEILHTHACRTTNHANKGRALSNLGVVYDLFGRHPEALEHQQRAIALFREIGDRDGEAQALCALGIVYNILGQYAESRDRFSAALNIFLELGDRHGESRALCNVGCVDLRLGNYAKALAAFQRSLSLFREVGSREGEGREYSNIGVAYERMGRYHDALEHHRQSLAIAREIGDVENEIEALNETGVTLRQLESLPKALEHHEQALVLARTIGDQKGEAKVLNSLGSTLLSMGQITSAEEHHRAALVRAEKLGYTLQQAHAQDGVAHCRHAMGDTAQATTHWRYAHALYSAMGTPEAQRVSAHLQSQAGLRRPRTPSDLRSLESANAHSGSESPAEQRKQAREDRRGRGDQQ